MRLRRRSSSGLARALRCKSDTASLHLCGAPITETTVSVCVKHRPSSHRLSNTQDFGACIPNTECYGIRMAKPKSKVAAPTTRAVLLFRVSTQRQADSGLGLEAQETACRKLCADRGWEILGAHVDAGISGKEGIDKRPGLAAAIADIKANPGAVLVVYSLSRLGRSQRLIWTLLDTQGDYALPLVSATEPFDTSTPMGRAMLGMLGVWSQLEADLVSERTTVALDAARERGTKLGAPSMIESTDESGARMIDPAKVALVRQVKELYASGEYSHKTLAEHLNASGIASVKGGRWHPRTVRVALFTELPLP